MSEISNSADRSATAGFSVLDSFFYLAPVWFLVETFLWPGFRAGIVTGGDLWGNIAFYSVEAGIGAAIWFKLPYANTGALIENIGYLIILMKMVLFTPLDIALAIGDDTAGAERMAYSYRASLPGIIYSMAHVVFRIKQGIRMRVDKIIK